MPLHTALCDLLDIQYPILQAPIGGLSTPALAAAVSNAGGLGLLSATWREPDALRRLLRETRSLTSRPFGVNLVLAFDIEDRLDICLDEGVRIVSFFWGNPARYISPVHRVGGLVLHTAGSASQARSAVDAGADIIVAQGMEAGGHVCSEVGTMALVPCTADAVPGTPVVAAGGIADGRGIAAALCLGAAGAMLGTRFIVSVLGDPDELAHPVVNGVPQRRRSPVEGESTHVNVDEHGSYRAAWPGNWLGRSLGTNVRFRRASNLAGRNASEA
jgi:nitronate monooxygenase